MTESSYNAGPLLERMHATLSAIPGDMDATGVVHLSVPAAPRCKVTIKRMAKGVQWEVEYSHEDPDQAARTAKGIHDQLEAEYGALPSE